MSQVTKLCNACIRPAELVCSRCCDPYCSIECQKSDWFRHRQICISMPSLTLHDADVLAQNFESSLFIKRPSESDATPLASESPRQNEENPEIEIPKQSSTMPVAKPDNETKPLSEKPQATLKFEATAPKIIQPPQQLPSGQPLSKQDSNKVDAKTIQIPQSLRGQPLRGPQKLIQVPETKNKAPKRFLFEDLKQRPWPKTSQVSVAVLCMLEDNILCFHEYTDEVTQYYELISAGIAKYCAVNKPKGSYQPVRDEIVLGMFENEWFRAQVCGPNVDDSEGYVLKYLEYGNMDVVKGSEIMPISEDLMFEMCTRFFTVDEISDQGLTDRQHEVLSQRVVTITNIRQDGKGDWKCSIVGF